MHAMVLTTPGAPLAWTELADRQPGPGPVRVKVGACGVRRTDLHAGVETLHLGQRVGVPWLGHTCGVCAYCLDQHENLCDRPLFTGYTRDGGFAAAALVDARFALPLDESGTDEAIAPLLCAGLIGWRALVMAGEGRRLGLHGFGGAAHILAQVAVWQGRSVFAFTRSGDTVGQGFARSLGASWAGGSEDKPPEPLDAAIIFAPVGGLVPLALRAVRKGGRVVCAGIHMSDIPSFPYRLLWEERQLVSVANLTRQDGIDSLRMVPPIGVVTKTMAYALKDANRALDDLRAGRFEGATVIVP